VRDLAREDIEQSFEAFQAALATGITEPLGDVAQDGLTFYGGLSGVVRLHPRGHPRGRQHRTDYKRTLGSGSGQRSPVTKDPHPRATIVACRFFWGSLDLRPEPQTLPIPGPNR
jgi:hypothetical protein